MAVAPRLPSLDPRDMLWVRWVTEQTQKHANEISTVKSNVQANAQQHGATAATVATTTQRAISDLSHAVLPTTPPQVPTAPMLSTDHGTVTIKWDGHVHGNQSYTPDAGDDKGGVQEPALGFNHVSVYRADAAAGPFVRIGGSMGLAGTVVDADVVVGQTYWYYFITTDNAKASSEPSDVASIVVKGVDLGTLDQDVADALQAANDAAQAGLEAGQAGQAAAQAALDAANSVDGKAASALQAANDAQQTAQSALAAAEEASGGTTSVVISNTAPNGDTTVLWIDTTNNANTPKRWSGTAWVALTDKAAIDAAAAAVTAKNAADAAQQTANTAVTNAQNAQGTANNALTAANGKNKVYYQANQPATTGNVIGDTWFETDADNKIYRWDGTAWTATQFGSGALAPNSVTASQLAGGVVDGTKLATAVNTSITNAQTTASNAATAASTAQQSANNKNTVNYSSSNPSNTTNPGVKQGDIWFTQDATGAVTGHFVWSGTGWIAQTLTNNVIATLDAGKINTGTLAAGRIGANTISANQMVTGTITAASGVLADAAITTAKIADAAITNAKISDLDAGKITAGTISAQRIGANSIAASQMIAGTITAASGILADAVITTAKIADAAVNNAKIANLAVDNAKIADLDGNKIQAGTIVAGKLSAGSVTTNNILAGAIDTNRLGAGAITADKLSLGVTAQATSPSNRVPAPVTDVNWWGQALAQYVNNATGAVGTWTHPNENGHVSNQTWGLVFSPTATERAIMGLMPMFLTPPSRKISIQWTASAPIAVQVREQNGDSVWWHGINTAPNGTVVVQLADTTTHYGVYVTVEAGWAQTSISQFSVFEVIGSSSAGQTAQLSPSGLQLYDANGQLAVDLTTNSSQYFSVVNNVGAEPDTVASIDQMGNAAFTQVSSDLGYDISGIQFTNFNSSTSLINSTPNGTTWDPDVVPLLDRFGRGVIYDVTWSTLNGFKSSAQYIRVAQDQFWLEDGRTYEFKVQTGGLQADLTSAGDPASTGQQALGVNCYLELQINTGANTSITSGTIISRAIVYNNMRGYWNLEPVVYTASANTTSIDTVNRVLPANIPLYWQVNFNMSSAPSRQLSLGEFGASRGLSIIDLGSANLTRMNSTNDALNPTTDRSTTGSSSGTTSTGTTSTSKTVTFTARSSRTWNNSGSSIVTGTGQYTNGAAMYYGYGASPMGSWFGGFTDSSGRSLNSVVGGKTVTGAVLTVRNTYTSSSSGASVQFGTASTPSAPSSINTPVNNVWSTSFSKGASKSMTLSSTIRSGLSSGGVQSFVLGVSSSSANYSYFHGASQSYPPTLKVTYH